MHAPTATHTRITSAAVVLFALLALLVPTAASAAASDDSLGFGVSPLRFDVETKPGTSSTHVISVTNTEERATKFTFSKEDFHGHRADPAATPVLLGGKFASDISGYDWLTVPDAITIPAGQTRNVPIKVTVPASATGAHYAALLVHGEERAAGNLVAQSRLGVLFLMNAAGAPPPEIVITEVREVGPDRTVTEFINKGKGPTKNTQGTITTKPVMPGGKTEEIKGKCTPIVLPDGAGRCEFDRNDPKGDGSGDAGVGDGNGNRSFGPSERHVDIVGDPGGEGTSARGELPTEWVGAWTSMLLPLVGVALFVLYFLFLRRRRQQEADDEVDGSWPQPVT